MGGRRRLVVVIVSSATRVQRARTNGMDFSVFTRVFRGKAMKSRWPLFGIQRCKTPGFSGYTVRYFSADNPRFSKALGLPIVLER